MEESHILGRRKLAYAINKQTHAIYALMYFRSPAEAIDKLRKKYHLDQNILRELIFIKDKKLPLNEIKG